MKVYQLFEEERPQLYQWLWEHCTPYLTELGLSHKDGLRDIFDVATLYRGENDDGKVEKFQTSWGANVDGIIKSVRKDRLPRDTPKQLSKLFDDMLEHKFGWRPRQSSVFAFGRTSKGATRDYGRTTYRIFPIGNFKYVWSPVVRDLTFSIPGIAKAAGITKPYNIESDWEPEELAGFSKALSNTLEDTYKDTDLRSMAKGGNEVMIGCDKYLAIPA